jgi:tRNA threonylcarbamoyladenosine modification (KEOPS) complex Cgi121 subunit
VLVAGVRRIDDNRDAGKLLDRLRAENPGVMVQAADAVAVYGRDHALGALDIALEAMTRKIMIANRPETEVLLRLACTDQIAEAMNRARLREGAAGCIIAFSSDAQALKKFGEQITQEFTLDDSVISQSGEKKKALAKTVGISPGTGDDGKFLNLLLERGAILVRS